MSETLGVQGLQATMWIHFKCLQRQGIYKGVAWGPPCPATGHEKETGHEKGVADSIFTDNELCTSSCSLLLSVKLFPSRFATWQRRHINSCGASINLVIPTEKILHNVFFFPHFNFCSVLQGCLPCAWLHCGSGGDTSYSLFPPETWALSLTTDHTGTLSIPLLDAPIIRCVHKAFF